ncbi:MAG: Inositol monophosphatase [Parcubacteria group bacterium GW2011_GWA1_42_7]|nr:MAG: Inositol monophosphatase [Parcubacteria group bacterium GW2011_GWB1_42_6]KKS69930.1 MAG: Inositol monophosphatase [Parcubacteria group bacterium GW2011_GWA1_42_7]KKS92207.1 MAG: Inositol monophosphatase [Parcubacteria group bacterium GW2011_GWC1_43_12]
MEDYLNLAKKIAEGSAQIALKYFGFDIEKTWKNDSTPLTQADTEINRFVIDEINRVYPGHSIKGEEESDEKAESMYVWVCDPIDGTMQFSCGLPIFTFSLALVEKSNGLPILGIVNDPIMKNMYWACKGEGAYRNGRKIRVSSDKNLNNTFLNTDGSGKDIGFSGDLTLGALCEKGAKVMKLLSVIYGGIQVANGKFSGTVFFNPYAHDVAALKIITEEAGGKVTDLDGNERRYDKDGLGCIISNRIVHGEILGCVKKHL